MTDFTDITKTEALAVLQGALDRGEFRTGRDWGGDVVEVKYGTRWLQVARADQEDEVRSGYEFEGRTAEEMLRYWMTEHVIFGARVTEDAFYCLDSLTDG